MNLVPLSALRAPETRGRADLAGVLRLRDWLHDFLMRAHPDLGRPGAVCPFTSQAARLDTIRVGASDRGENDVAVIEAQVDAAVAAFEKIETPPNQSIFRAVIVAFPGCDSERGVEVLQRAVKRYRLKSVIGGRMIAVLHARAEAEGLWNPAFRPLRAPFPVFAIREMTAQDAPFAMQQPLLLPGYLARFPIAGPKRIFELLRARRRARAAPDKNRQEAGA